MKTFTVLSLALLMAFAVGCSNDNTTAPASDNALNFDVIGDDAPVSAEAAMQEFTDLSIAVPDPVEPSDPTINRDPNEEAVEEIIAGASLDDPERVNFRRILAHLHQRMQMLRRCMADNDDPRLLRLAHGAHQAIQHGLRALENGEPRMALRYFHTANRALNLAHSICRGRG